MGWKQLLNRAICGHESDSVILQEKKQTNVKHLNIFLIFQPSCVVAANKSSDPTYHMDKAKGKNTNKKTVSANL